MLRKFLFYAINVIIILISFIILTVINFHVNNYIKLVFFICIILFFILSLLFRIFNFNKMSKLFYVMFIFIFLVSLSYYVLYKTNLINAFSSVNQLKNLILSTGSWGVIIYILIQAAQVIILPIPAAIICIVGSVVYGPLLGGLYCSLGVIIGSYIAFLIGKTFGYKLVSWIVGKDNINKYSQLISKSSWFFLVIAFLLPMFPDDILCLIAGITNINFKLFFIITLISRPIGVICMSYFGSGHLIPFNGWGIYAWITILIGAIIMIVLTYKYQDKMQEFVLNKVFKRNHKNY